MQQIWRQQKSIEVLKNPELVAFLKQLDSLRKVLDDKTQMVIDLNTPPFNLMSGEFFHDLKEKAEKKSKCQKIQKTTFPLTKVRSL